MDTIIDMIPRWLMQFTFVSHCHALQSMAQQSVANCTPGTQIVSLQKLNYCQRRETAMACLWNCIKKQRHTNSKFTTAKLLPKKRDMYDMFMKLHKEAKVLSVFKSSSDALVMVEVDGTCLTVRIKKKFIIFTTKCTYRTHINKVTRFPNLENVYCLIAKRHNSQ